MFQLISKQFQFSVGKIPLSESVKVLIRAVLYESVEAAFHIPDAVDGTCPSLVTTLPVQ